MNKKKNPAHYWLGLIGIAFQMGIIIYGGAKLGQWLDHQYSTDSNTYTIIFTLLGVVISMYLVVRQTKRLNP
ncbi:AtpZ/AtpI family protein [Eudoraea chungangensis]|uniref:AtpZ/AtpI family protein n=1 Tax=Eudoraea chungangensis TaxID=1481905 RepID=UPI0023EE05BE|nr:AtpZ/AtpI family protein [Eudoraea chungangensis]